MKKTRKLSSEINIFIILFLFVVIFFQAVIGMYCLKLIDDKKMAWKGAIHRDFEYYASENMNELAKARDNLINSKDLIEQVTSENPRFDSIREKIYGMQDFMSGTIHVSAFNKSGAMTPVSGNISDEEAENARNSFLLYISEFEKTNTPLEEFAYYTFFEFSTGEYHNFYFVSFSPIVDPGYTEESNKVVGHLCTFTLVEAEKEFAGYEEVSDINITLKSDGTKSIIVSGRGTDNFLLTEKWTNEKIKGTNWHTDGSITLSAGKFDWTSLLGIFVLESVLLVIIILIFRRKLKHNTIEPLKKIGKFMRFFRISDSFKPLEIEGNEDLIELSGEVNKMVKRNKTLANDIMTKQGKLYEAENLKNEATLYALQNQVNPHYLYNIFELIRSIALVRGVNEIETISVNVSEIFRYNLKKENVALLSDEYEITKRYVSIMQVKYGDSFDVVYDLAEETLDKSVIKMIFQPLIENAFNHGYVRRKDKFFVKIRSWMENDTLCLSFYDNGLGMTKERLLEINEKIKADKMASGKGIGIANLAHRLKMMYGKNCTFRIESEKDKFAEIIITINM